jgi:tRNA dimethylallyltransferase
VDETQAIIVVLGPTAAGKSALALFLAERLGGEIVNFDSLQLYRHFDIGTAKPPEPERRAVPHHLIDVLEPETVFSAGDYARQAAASVQEIAVRGRLPILAGGAGFYLRALLEGLFAGPQRDERLRERLRQAERRRPAGYLHRLLARLDPASAARIHPNDTPKLIRAIEVCLRARRPMSALFCEAPGGAALAGVRAIKLGLDPPRRLLYERINKRAAGMFEAGLVEEVRRILAAGVPPSAKPFESVGYGEALAVVEGRLSLAQAIEATRIRTRHYAKRQITWFRRETDVHWIAAFGDEPAAQNQAVRLLGFRP